ncbi:retinol-binding protein pinta [Eurytemora carolleeae]|uniref:retinol-binding protein pinta n=1 Tax=Eurytemora carolleeae TaxID=1294199 RepID=UPI000C768B11|nr:retinol-binding protein pinta [Eurytemora carolleeae]|eukprot:XP_023321804.1 retinol-binding protein pinta-like [Eurytemora affinis]
MPSNGDVNALSLPEVLEAARIELGEDKKQMEEGVKMLREWIKKSPHLHSIKQDDTTLEMFFRGCKYSLERTKEKLDFFNTVRGNLPEWFDSWDPRIPVLKDIIDAGIYLPLRGYDKDGRFVVLMRNGSSNPKTMKLEDTFKVSTMIIELAMRTNIQAQVKGFVLIQDMAGMTAQHAVQFNPVIAKKAMTVWQDAYPAKPKALHFLNMPGAMESIFSMVQSLQKQKMKERNHVHSKGSLEKLHQHLGTEVLPKEYGGSNGSVEELVDYWKREVEQNRDWLMEQPRYKSDEKKRPGKPKLHADIFGIEGSFRKLEID